jgi:hypothetical protein
MQDFKLVKNNQVSRNIMAKIGQTFIANDNLLAEFEKAVCLLYGNIRETDFNIQWHAMFGSLTTDPAKLPPCKDACD